MMRVEQICVILSVIVTVAVANNELARGWGDSIEWMELDKALEHAQTVDKPIMLLIHKSWCGACKSLKPQFANSQKIAKLSENFVMVNALDDEEPKEEKYSPDGGYIPRIFFMNPNGEIMSDVYNEGGNAQYKYFYPNPDSVVTSMKKVAEGRGVKDTKKEL